MVEYISRADEFISDIRNEFFSNMESALKVYELDLKEALDVPPRRTGAVYFNVKGKAVHVAAAPSPDQARHSLGSSFGTPGMWEPPAKLSGELLASIDSQSSSSTYHWSGFTYSNVPYVIALEMGRAGPNPMPPRPAWWHTLVSNWDKYADIALDGFERR